jgi:hypothetical protein
MGTTTVVNRRADGSTVTAISPNDPEEALTLAAKMPSRMFWDGHAIKEVERAASSIEVTTACGEKFSIAITMPFVPDKKRAAGPVTCEKCKG